MKNYIQTELLQRVPLDYQDLDGPSISLFARDIYCKGNENAEILVFFNGGPGFSCVRDWRNSAWGIEALETYRVILLDQRGTGRSQLIDLAMLNQFSSSEELLNYLIHFRADNIVRDTEFLRQHIFEREKITILGQSFGGFVALTYLSFFPQSLSKVFITAGIPPLTCSSVTEVYEALTKTLILRNEQFYQRYPEDKIKVQIIADILRASPMKIADEMLTLQRFLTLGWYLGSEDGLETLHHFLEDAFCDETMTQLSWRFSKTMLQATSFWEVNPLYAVLHETIYCNGYASHWAADQVMQSIEGFSLQQKLPYFSGEMAKNFMFQNYNGLEKFSKVVDLLAEKTDWPLLYDIDALKNNTVPVATLLMKNDFYVDYNLAQLALAKINNVQVWRHETWQHDALRKHGKEVVQKLFKMI